MLFREYIYMLLIGIFISRTLPSCSRESIPDGQILLRNDIQDSANNKIVVDNIIGKSGRTGLRYSLSPGETALIPQRGIRAMRFSRKYDSFSRVYRVSCPPTLKTGISIKLIDVHTGRLKGGCKLVRKGKKKSGVIYWE